MHKTSFDISVIVPVFNAEPFLAECVESILNQHEATFEVVLVDDGSTDASGALCDGWAARDSRIRVFHQRNAGVSVARNVGLEVAAGGFVVFVDADDRLEPRALTILLERQRATGAEVVRGRMREIFDDSMPAAFSSGSGMFDPPRDGILYIGESGAKPRLCFMGSVCACLINLDLVRRHDIKFDASLRRSQDSRFMATLASVVEKYAFVDELVYVYRRNAIHSTTVCYSAGRSSGLRNALDTFAFIYDRLSGAYRKELVDAALGDVYVNYMIRLMVSYGADDLVEYRSCSLDKYRRAMDDPLLRRFLRYYDPSARPGRSKIIPWLIRLRMARLLAHVCRRKAGVRFASDIAALRMARTGTAEIV